MLNSVESNLPRICYRLMLSVRWFILRKGKSSWWRKDRFSLTLFWRMRLTGPRRKCNRPCWRRCRSVRWLSGIWLTSWKNHSWWWQPRIRSSRKVLILFLRLRLTVSCWKWLLIIRKKTKKNWSFVRIWRKFIPSLTRSYSRKIFCGLVRW